MYGYIILKTLTIFLAIRMVKSDRFDNVQQSPEPYSTSSLSGGPASFSYRSGNGDPKNLYKAPSNVPSTTSNPSLLHKTHLSPPRAHVDNEQHRDFVPIVKQTFQPNSGDGAYAFSYETGNGISASEYGTYKAGPTGEESIQSAAGSYTYTGPDNIVYTVTYIAGLEGFVPQGAHLPTPPPVPEAINKALQHSDGGKYHGLTDPDTDGNEVNKYHQLIESGKSDESNKVQYAIDKKYQSRNGAGTSSSTKYTAAVQIPYTGITSGANFDKSFVANEYKVHDESSN